MISVTLRNIKDLQILNSYLMVEITAVCFNYVVKMCQLFGWITLSLKHAATMNQSSGEISVTSDSDEQEEMDVIDEVLNEGVDRGRLKGLVCNERALLSGVSKSSQHCFFMFTSSELKLSSSILRTPMQSLMLTLLLRPLVMRHSSEFLTLVFVDETDAFLL